MNPKKLSPNKIEQKKNIPKYNIASKKIEINKLILKKCKINGVSATKNWQLVFFYKNFEVAS